MDSVLEVLGIFLRLFIASGLAIAVGAAVSIAGALAGVDDHASFGLLTCGLVLGHRYNWVWGE